MAADNFLWFPAKATGGLISTNNANQPLGESTDAFFSKKHAIEISEFSFGITQAETSGSATSGAGAGKAKFDEFTIKKVVDKSSPALYQACAAGAHFPSVYLGMRKAGGAQLLYLEYIFVMVFITGITWSGGSGEELPTEEVKFKFGAMGMQYQAQDNSGQAAGAPQFANWSVVANSATLTAPPSLTTAPTFDKPTDTATS
ncbi:MAG TPA: type VI secretion system tube protein Hcp [Bryobacteraceae bacterium]|jgi:type VI secretion system Hcp family effector|nr:type VI secretion system tube protein Hcp [Bryobacteraceae bacterium]